MRGSLNDLINSDQPTFIDFSAEWCGPCKMMAPILDEFKSKVGDKVKVVKIDIDRNPSVAMMYKVNSVPTLMLFKSGQLVWRQSGVVPTNQLVKVVDNYLR